MKRSLAMVLALVLVTGLAGCGNKGTDPAIKQAAKENVYKYEELNVFGTGEEYSPDYSIMTMNYMGDRVAMLVNTYAYTEDSWSEDIQLVTIKPDGTDKQTTVLFKRDAQTNFDAYLSNFLVTENYVYGVSEKNDYENVDEYGNPDRTVELVCWDMNGQEQSRVSILPEDLPEGEWFYVERMIPMGQDQVMISAAQEYTIYNPSGAVVGKPKLNLENGFSDLYTTKDGKTLISMWDANYTEMQVAEVDLATGQVGEPIDLPFNLNYYSIKSSKYYDLLLTDSLGVYGYNIGDAAPTPMMNYINSDLSASNLNQIIEISETQFLASYYDYHNYGQQIATFTYVDPATIPDKEVITIASYYLDYQMRTRVVEYNKTNEKYRIMLNDYSQYAQTDDYLAGYTKLNNDILAGNMPDILILDENLPVDSYISKGLLADIYELIDEDEELSREDYFQNVFDAYSSDGKLYAIVPQFNVWTVMGKAEDVGQEPGWSMQEMQALLASKPEGTTLFGEEMTRASLMYYATTMALPQFIDKETGVCSFESQGFIDILEFLKTMPEEFQTDYEDPDYWTKQEMQYLEGRTLLMPMTISEIPSLIYNFGNFGTTDMTFIGFPTQDGIGAVLNCYDRYAISAKSPNKEGAWEFLRYYLTDEYQESVYQMPVNKEIWMEKAMKATEKPYWENEDGEREYYDYTVWLGGKDVILDPMTKEQVQEIFDYVSSVTLTYSYEQSLVEIIEEEAAYFFDGKKSAQEAAKIIQGRIQLYVDENR